MIMNMLLFYQYYYNHALLNLYLQISDINIFISLTWVRILMRLDSLIENVSLDVFYALIHPV